jgi:hypothetical protein
MKDHMKIILIMLLFFSSDNLIAANRYWVYKGGLFGNPSNWNNAANWSGMSGGLGGLVGVPGTGDVVIFDGGPLGLSKGKCIIDVPVSVAGITITSGYTGTITQGANTVSVSGDASFGGAVYSGGSANITIGGNFTISGTAFTSTSATLELDGNAAFTGGSFSHNNGLVKFNGSSSQTISGTSPVLYALEFVGTGNSCSLLSTGNIIVLNNLGISGSASCTLNSGLLDLRGNLNLTNTANGGGGSTIIAFTGAAGQDINGSPALNQSTLPAIRISKTGGVLSLPALITVDGDWTYTSGTVDITTNNSTVAFAGNLSISSAGMQFNNFEVTGNNSTLLNDLAVNKNLVISGTGVLSAGSNTINLSGNWTDRGTTGFTEGSGTVQFNGTAMQTISSAGGEDFNNLLLNNSGAGIQLLNSVSVAGTFTMTKGDMDLNGNGVTLGTSAANTGTLSYTAGIMYGAGSFTRWFNTGSVPDGSMRGFYPLGTVNDFRPFYLSAPSAGPATGGMVSVAYSDAIGNTTTPVFMDGSSPIEVRKDLHWTVSAGNGISGGTYNLSVGGNDLGIIADVSDLRLTLAASVVGSPGVNTGTIEDPVVNRTGLAAADLSNSFYIGSTNDVSSPLPIKLLSFTASATGDAVRLKWTTASEINNAYFFIRKSEDEQNWTNLERINGAAGKGPELSYAMIDTHPFQGTSYYQLVQVDYDGKETYSGIRSVKLQQLSGDMLVYPNPASDLVTVLFPKTGRYEVSLSDSRGRQELHTTINADKLVLNISGLEPGIYYIRWNHDQHAQIRKLLVHK